MHGRGDRFAAKPSRLVSHAVQRAFDPRSAKAALRSERHPKGRSPVARSVGRRLLLVGSRRARCLSRAFASLLRQLAGGRVSLLSAADRGVHARHTSRHKEGVVSPVRCIGSDLRLRPPCHAGVLGASGTSRRGTSRAKRVRRDEQGKRDRERYASTL